MNRWVGKWMIGVGVMHSIIGFILFPAPLREIVGARLWNSVNVGTPMRYLAFWFLFAGVAAILIGYLGDWIERVAKQPIPRAYGWTLLGIAVVGVVVTPVSGFWLVFPAALGALAQRQNVATGKAGAPA